MTEMHRPGLYVAAAIWRSVGIMPGDIVLVTRYEMPAWRSTLHMCDVVTVSGNFCRLDVSSSPRELVPLEEYADAWLERHVH